QSLLVSDLTTQFRAFEALNIGLGATVTGELTAFESVDVSGTLALGMGSLVAGEAVFGPDSILEIEIGSDDHGRAELGRLTIINGSKVRIVNTTKRTGTFDIMLFDERVFEGTGPAPKFTIDYDDDDLVARLD